MNTLFEAVKAALVANHGWVVDDVRAARVVAIDQSPLKLTCIAKAGEFAVALIPERFIHGFQKLYVDDQGTVHLSAEEVDGALAIVFSKDESIDVAVEVFNNGVREYLDDEPSWFVLTDLTHIDPVSQAT